MRSKILALISLWGLVASIARPGLPLTPLPTRNRKISGPTTSPFWKAGLGCSAASPRMRDLPRPVLLGPSARGSYRSIGNREP